MGIPIWYRRGGAPVSSVIVESQVQTEPQTSRILASGERDKDQQAPESGLETLQKSIPDDQQTGQTDVAGEADPVEFFWWRGAGGILMMGPPANYEEPMLRDLLAALDWRAGLEPGKVSNGHFRWPQLVSTSGSPTRAIRAFFDQTLPETVSWVMCTHALVQVLSEYIEFAVPVEVLPEQLHLAQQKKSLWQVLAK